MSKKAMVTVLIGTRHNNIAELSHPTQKAYAHRHGLDYIVYDSKEYTVYGSDGSRSVIEQCCPVVTGKTAPMLSNPAFGAYNKLNVFELLEHYDRIVYIDTDIIVRDDAPNIFDVVPSDKVGMMCETGLLGNDRAQLMQEWSQKHNADISDWNGQYYNTGVMVMSRGHEKVLNGCEHFYDDTFFEQTPINMNIIDYKIPMHELPYSFNRTSFMDFQMDEPRHSSYFIHYAGSWMMLKEGHSKTADHLLKIMRYDLEKWKSGSPKHNYERVAGSNPLGFWVRD